MKAGGPGHQGESPVCRGLRSTEPALSLNRKERTFACAGRFHNRSQHQARRFSLKLPLRRQRGAEAQKSASNRMQQPYEKLVGSVSPTDESGEEQSQSKMSVKHAGKCSAGGNNLLVSLIL